MMRSCLLWFPSVVALAPTVKLSNGVEMPVLAFGANVWEPETCRNATSEALAAGFRFIWSSALIGEDCQRAQRAALEAAHVSGVFLSGTVNTQGCETRAACCPRLLGQWAALEELYPARARVIAVSNFGAP